MRGLIGHLSADEVVPGAAVVWDGIRLEVVEADDGRTTRVRAAKLPRCVAPPR